jgi:hypothetical protein
MPRIYEKLMENKKEEILGSDNTVYSNGGGDTLTLDKILEGWRQGSQASYNMTKCPGCSKNIIYGLWPSHCPFCGSITDPSYTAFKGYGNDGK